MTMSSSRRGRRAVLAVGCSGLIFAVSGLAAATAAPASHATHGTHAKKHKQPKVTPGSRYLALGDSISFGYREAKAVPKPKYNKQKSFIGYPEDVAKNLDLKVTNAACPGETTGSFIKTSAQSNGCENSYSTTTPHKVPGGYRTLHPLHVKYKNAKQSQLAFAEAFLKKHPGTRLVSLMIGANDGLLCFKRTTDGCASEVSQVTKQVKKHVTKIMKGIRNKAHYRGQVVLLTYYSLDYSNGLDNIQETLLNDALKKAVKPYNVEIADGFGQFKKASRQAHGNLCNAGLVTSTPTDTSPCGIHPSYAGQAVLAQAVERAIKK